MTDGGFSKAGVFSTLLWTLVAMMLGGAWYVGLFIAEEWRVAGLLAATGCATSAMAATLQIKTYACRVSRLVRVTSGIEQPMPASELRSVR